MQILDPQPGAVSGPSAVTIGKFDGVHIGHQKLLARTRELARGIGGPAGVITFDRHPLELLRPGSAPPRLTPLPERLDLLERAGMDFCLLLRLDTGLLDWPAERFEEEIITRSAAARYVVTGGDFRYGHDRAGDVETLARAGEAAGYEVQVLPPVMIGGRRVSSYSIREALSEGNLALANAMLGRPYDVGGRVVEGRRLGRTLGYPTANIAPEEGRALPRLGIYAVTADWGEGPRPAVASLGVRPTIEAEGAPVWLEVHVLDWEGDLYGRYLRVTFVQHLRPEERFPSLDALKEQMARDLKDARAAL